MTEKTYTTAKELRSAIDRYFASIRYTEPVTRLVPVTEDREFIRNGERVTMTVPVLDKYGHQLMAIEPVMRGKKPLLREVWVRPPCMPDLLEALRVSEASWRAMRGTDALAATCAYAGGRIEIYNIQRLDSPTANGAKFHLERKFGWGENEELDEGVELVLPEEADKWAK